jgi:hypothetical protein
MRQRLLGALGRQEGIPFEVVREGAVIGSFRSF